MSRYFHDYDNVAIFDLNEELAMGEHAYEISSSTKTPLLFPVNMDLSGLPPLCIHVGDHEVILSDSVRLAERARASNVHVESRIWPSMWHVFQSSAAFVPEARQSIDKIRVEREVREERGRGGGRRKRRRRSTVKDREEERAMKRARVYELGVCIACRQSRSSSYAEDTP